MDKSEARRNRIVDIIVPEDKQPLSHPGEPSRILCDSLPDLLARHLEHLHFARLLTPITLLCELQKGAGR